MSLTIVHADAREMAVNLEAGRASEQATIFARFVDQLRAGGCDAVALTSIGGHFCIAELEALSALPLMSAIPALHRHFAALGVARIGVLGTRAVMESRLYGVTSVDVAILPPDELAIAHSTYIAMAITGAATPDQCSYFHEAARRLHREQGAEVILLGGTDLSLAFGDVDLGFPIVDSALIHVEAIARASMAG
jgi:aspartate racemase